MDFLSPIVAGALLAVFALVLSRIEKGRFDLLKEYMDKRFDDVDRRFDGVDKRFDSVDRRFDSVDERFNSVDGRITRLETAMDTLRSDLTRVAVSLSEESRRRSS